MLDRPLTRRIDGLFILGRTMKSIWMATLTLLAAGHVLAGPDKPRDEPGGSGERAVVMPISVEGGEPRHGNPLRDALRQPFDDGNSGSEPYRLSVQERQRLREQIRAQPLPSPGRRP